MESKSAVFLLSGAEVTTTLRKTRSAASGRVARVEQSSYFYTGSQQSAEEVNEIRRKETHKTFDLQIKFKTFDMQIKKNEAEHCL